MIQKLLACVILVLFACVCPALDPDKAITQYVHNVWDVESGVPQNTINAVLQTRDRYLWIGTYDGLARFDGNHFTIFNKNNTILQDNLIQSLSEGRDGTLWIGTVGSGLYGVKDANWRHYSTKEGLSNDIVTVVREDSQGTLWIGTRMGLNQLKNGKLISYKTESLNYVVTSLQEDKHQNLWIGTPNGLHSFRNGKFTSYTTKEGLSADNVRSLYEDAQGNLWIGTNGGGLNKLSEGKFSSYSTKQGLSNDSVNCIHGDREGNLWIGTVSGLNRLTNGNISRFSSKEGLSDEGVLSLQEDVEGSLWIGTSGGLNRLRDGKFTSFTMQEGLSGTAVWSVFEDSDANMWIGTSAGLNSLRNGKFTGYTIKDGLAGDAVSSVHGDSGGSLWAGIEDSGLNRIRNGKITLYSTKEGLSGNHVLSLYVDRKGSLWVGTTNGLSVFQDEKLSTLPVTDELPRAQVRAIVEDQQGNLWIGMLGGLSRLKDGKFTRYGTKEGLTGDLILALYADREGALWIGTTTGLNRAKNGKFARITTRDGLSSDAIASIVEDDNDNLWMCTGVGISRISKKAANEFIDGKTPGLASVSYSKADGIKRDCNGGQQPSIWKAKDGRIWFASSLGAVVVNPKNLRTNPMPPPVVIEGIVADNESIWSSPVQPQTADFNSQQSIRIESRKERFEFRYTALSFTAPERVKFRFLLEGLDDEWVDAGVKREAVYTNLPPGNYKFRVKASNEDGVWNETGAAIGFYLVPRFYQTKWFYGICLLAIFVLAASAHRFRIRQLEVRERELIAAVERGTRELREANKRLHEAEDRILKTTESGPREFESFAVWSNLLTEDIARVIGAQQIGIWKLEEEEFIPLVRCRMNAPSLKDLKLSNSNFIERDQEATIPIKGISGEIYGVIVVAREKSLWEDEERHLVASFANRLGGTFEMERMREKLAESEQKRTATLQEMWDDGIATVQLCPVCKRCYDHTALSCETDGSQLYAPRVLPYKVSNRYRLTIFLGEGGMGAVFQAEDEKLRRYVSLKIIHAERLIEPTMRRRIQREAQILAQIQHPGVISVYDFGELPDGATYMVMEFLEGEDLQSILKRDGPGTPEQVANVLEQVGEALHTSHAKGVIHRDLKPSNLFVLSSGPELQIKVLDFGLAKSAMDNLPLTVTGLIMGTPAYMSPEQARGHQMNEQSDLFSLASLTQELLTERLPFQGDNVADVLIKIVSVDPLPLSALLTGTPKELDSVFSAAFSKTAGDRPKNLLEWARRVAFLLRQTPASVSGWRLR